MTAAVVPHSLDEEPGSSRDVVIGGDVDYLSNVRF